MIGSSIIIIYSSAFSVLATSEIVFVRPAIPCKSDGIMIFVALPSAAFANASRLFSVKTASSAPAALINSIPSAVAFCTVRIASA